MSAEIIYTGDPADLTLSEGDRYEIAESDASDARRIVRRDFDGDPTSLTFDPGSATALVFRLGGRRRPVKSEYVRQQHLAAHIAYRLGRVR